MKIDLREREREDEWYGLDWSVSGWEPVESFCKCGNEPSGCIKYLGVLE
jgi:hypothetical protein